MYDFGKTCTNCSKYMTCRTSMKCGDVKTEWEPDPIFKMSYMKVTCISERGGLVNRVEVGKTYYVKRTSIYMDSDGDAYGEVYQDIQEPGARYVGNLLLKHFQTVE